MLKKSGIIMMLLMNLALVILIMYTGIFTTGVKIKHSQPHHLNNEIIS